MLQRFEDRRAAGRLLATKLQEYAGRPDAIVLALPRGGVPVAFEVAQALGLPLDVFVVRKLGAPGHEEFALGSIAAGDVCLINETYVNALQVSQDVLDGIIRRESHELKRRERLYRDGRPPANLVGQTVIVVDDGLATGLSMRAAAVAIKRLGPKKVVAAVPVCGPVTCDELERAVDVLCVCYQAPQSFQAVGLWYKNFQQTTDEEVQSLLALANARAPEKPAKVSYGR